VQKIDTQSPAAPHMEAQQSGKRQIAHSLAEFLREPQHYVELRYFLQSARMCALIVIYARALYRSSHAHMGMQAFGENP
jgi:hypothetical protein